jgi:carboxyl-terminal processing protease
MGLRAEEVSPGMRAYVLGKLFQSIPLYFAHWQDALLEKDELDSSFARVTEEAMTCQDRRAFSLTVMAFLARLNNGHTRFLDPAINELPPLGISLRPVEERWTIVASDRQELRPGDVVLGLQDRPVEDWYRDLQRYAVGSSQSRTAQFGEPHAIFPALLALFLPDCYTVEVEDAEGTHRTLTVQRTEEEHLMAVPRTEGRWIGHDLAYVRIASFLSPEFEEQALGYVDEFRTAVKLIVDLRGNGGGSTPERLTRALMNRPYRWWSESSPLNVGLFSYQAQLGHNAHLFGDSQLLWRSPGRDPDPEAYPGRVILLVDRATYSAAEDFAMPFKDNGRAILMGEPTGGSTGQPYYHSFENGMAFAIGTKRAHLPSGGGFEGVGLAPDICVLPSREDLYGGRDTVLQAAISAVEAQRCEDLD